MKKDAPAQWKFRINAEMLPSYIPTRVADKVCNSSSSGPGCSNVGEHYPSDKSLSSGSMMSVILIGWIAIYLVGSLSFKTMNSSMPFNSTDHLFYRFCL